MSISKESIQITVLMYSSFFSFFSVVINPIIIIPLHHFTRLRINSDAEITLRKKLKTHNTQIEERNKRSNTLLLLHHYVIFVACYKV